MKKVSQFPLLVACCFVCALALLFSCQSDDAENPDAENPLTKICKRVEMSWRDADDPSSLIIFFDDNGRVTSARGSSDDSELDLVLQYDSRGLIMNDLGEDYEIQMDVSTKKVTMFSFGDLKFGPAQKFTFNNDRIDSSYVINPDKEGVETEKYTYDDDGNATRVEANVIEGNNGNSVGKYVVEFAYDKTHKALFANAPFLQAYATFITYSLPFGLTNQNLISHMTITFTLDDNVTVEQRIVNYTFNDQGMVTSLAYATPGGNFLTDFTYNCD